MIKGLILLADGFEDSEALCTRDVLIRSGIVVETASIKPFVDVVSSFGISLKCDKTVGKIRPNEYDFLLLPGGGKGTEELAGSDIVRQIIEEFYKQDKLLCAICAAPSVYGKYGYLKGKRYTCFPGFEDGIDGIYTGEEITISDKLITARSMAYSISFGEAIIDHFLGNDALKRVDNGIKGLARKK